MTKGFDNSFTDDQFATPQLNDSEDSLDDKFADQTQLEKNKQARLRIEALKEQKKLKELLDDSDDW